MAAVFSLHCKTSGGMGGCQASLIRRLKPTASDLGACSGLIRRQSDKSRRQVILAIYNPLADLRQQSGTASVGGQKPMANNIMHVTHSHTSRHSSLITDHNLLKISRHILAV
jgi:hypothetical protein